MPKHIKDRSVSFDRSRASPYPCNSSGSLFPNPPECEQNVKEWEEARCPVCMEHPHNALLLMCSSREKGCRPYMCDTSYRHSNCFDQFRKSFPEETAPLPTVEHSTGYPISEVVTNCPFAIDGSTSMHPMSCENEVKTNLVCPLCRGHITGWTVVDSARSFMNLKSRSCACETCDFTGSYKDLRKHARVDHPCVRPSEADPERQRSWRRLERQRDLGDLISTLQSTIGDERSSGDDDDDESLLGFDEGGWLTVFFLIRVFQPRSTLRRRRRSSSSWSGTSRGSAQVTVRRRSTRLWGETHDVENGSVSRDDDNDESSDAGSGSWSPWEERNRRGSTPENEQ